MKLERLLAALSEDIHLDPPPPVLTDELRALGFREFDASRWPDIGPDDLAEVLFKDWEHVIGTLSHIKADVVAFWRPFEPEIQGWQPNIGQWPNVDPQTEVQAVFGNSPINTRRAFKSAWGLTIEDSKAMTFWRVKPADYDRLFTPPPTAEPDSAPPAQPASQTTDAEAT